MSVSSTKVLKLTKKILKGNEHNPAAALQAIPAGSHVSLSATMLDVLVHMKHIGQIEIPKYGFTIRNDWLYCQKGARASTPILRQILQTVPWINGLSVGLLDTFGIGSFVIDKSCAEPCFPKNCLKHLVIYEDIPEYEEGWPWTLQCIIRDNIGSLVTFSADELPCTDTRIFESLQYLRIRNDYYKRNLKIEYFPKLMLLDIPYMQFPSICIKTMRFENNLPYGFNCATWSHAMHNLKRHRAAVYTYLKFTPVLSRDVARIIFCMVKAMPSTEWKLNENDIPSKFKHDTSGTFKYIADVFDPEYIEMASNYQDLVRLEEDEHFFQQEVESLHKKRKKTEEDIIDYQNKLDESKIKIQRRAEYVLPLIQQFLK